MSADSTQNAEPPTQGKGTSFTYDAFLSYNHQDGAVAAGIQKGLHRIGRRVGQLHALRVFRDTTDLAANPDLWGNVTESMDRSRYLIVVLSPRASASPWVDREVTYWLERHGPEQLLIVVAEGHLHWDDATRRFDPDRSDAALPVLTKQRVLAAEPLHVDITGDAPWDPQAPTFRDKLTDLAAPIHGKSKYELASDDVREQRRFRRLRRMAVTALVILTITGVTSATAVNTRQQAVTAVINHTEPLAFAAGQLYTTLSVADAAAATAFIADAEPREVRQRYEQAITDAAVALTRATGGVAEPALSELLGRINARLAVYTGLIETARTNGRVGNPVGVSYQAEASALMQQAILPDAQQLYQQISSRLNVETTASSRIPAAVFVIVFVTLVGGLYSTRWWARRPPGRLNIGFVAGGLALLVMMVWVATAFAICIANGRSAKGPGDSFETITALAITTQQARADETLALLRRGDEDTRTQSFSQRTETMQRQLSDYLSGADAIAKAELADAEHMLKRWRAADDRISQYIAIGDYQAATQVALGTAEDDSTPAFDKLSTALAAGIHESRRQWRIDILNARRGFSGATAGVVVLSVVAGVAVIAGLWPSPKEER